MLICRIAWDKDGTDELRKQHYDGHRAHLRSGVDKGIVQSGPFFSANGKNTKLGALIVFDVESFEQAKAFSDADPFIANGIYGVVQYVRWDKTIG